MPWFRLFPMGIPRSMLAERGFRTLRSGLGLDMAALRIAGECLSVGESMFPSTFPSSFHMAPWGPDTESAESYGGECPIPESWESPQPHRDLPMVLPSSRLLRRSRSKLESNLSSNLLSLKLLLSRRPCKDRSLRLLVRKEFEPSPWPERPLWEDEG